MLTLNETNPCHVFCEIGYGFSSAPTKPGFGVSEIAQTFHELMLKLGYDKYVAQGQPSCQDYLL